VAGIERGALAQDGRVDERLRMEASTNSQSRWSPRASLASIKIMGLEAPAGSSPLCLGQGLGVDPDQAVLPAGRRLRGLGADAVCVVAVGVMEGTAVPIAASTARAPSGSLRG
jgi:hypothetical protein